MAKNCQLTIVRAEQTESHEKQLIIYVSLDTSVHTVCMSGIHEILYDWPSIFFVIFLLSPLLLSPLILPLPLLLSSTSILFLHLFFHLFLHFQLLIFFLFLLLLLSLTFLLLLLCSLLKKLFLRNVWQFYVLNSDKFIYL